MFKPFHSHVHEYASPGEGNYKFLERKCCQMATGQKNVMPDFPILNEVPVFFVFGLFMCPQWACFNHFIATYMSMQGRRNTSPNLFCNFLTFSYSFYIQMK